MSPADSEELDPPLWGYRERTRAVLRHLILERGINPNHPLVTGYDLHLSLTTAHAEYTRGLELCPPGLDLVALRTVCFRGADLSFRYCDRVATSIYQEEREEKESPPKGQRGGRDGRNHQYHQQGGERQWQHQGRNWNRDGNRNYNNNNEKKY